MVKGFVEPLETNEFIKIASDDPEARAAVSELIAHCGRTALDIGPLANARGIERSVATEVSR